MKFIKYFFASIFSIILLSCDTDGFNPIVELDLPKHEPQLAITAHLSNIDSMFVYVTQTVGILEEEQRQPLDEAIVKLYENGETEVGSFEYKPSRINSIDNDDVLYGIFKSNPIQFKEGIPYTLIVEEQHLGISQSIQYFPQTVPILDAIYEANAAATLIGERVDEIAISFKDVSAEDNYYLLNAFYEFKDSLGQLKKITLPLLVVDPISQEINNGLLFNDATFNGQLYHLRIGIANDKYPQQTRIYLTLYNVSKDRYLFELDTNNYDTIKDNPFAEPTTIYENIDGGSGIFTLNNGNQFIVELY